MNGKMVSKLFCPKCNKDKYSEHKFSFAESIIGGVKMKACEVFQCIKCNSILEKFK